MTNQIIEEGVDYPTNRTVVSIIPMVHLLMLVCIKSYLEVPKEGEDVTLLQSRRDIAYAVQIQNTRTSYRTY